MTEQELQIAQTEMRERQLYGEIETPPTLARVRGKAGRKPVGSGYSTAAVRDRVTAWKLTPAEKRQPPTIRGLAAELGVSKSTVEYHLGRAPDGLSELMQAAESDELRNRYPGILKVLGELAEAGNIEAIKVYLRELAGPRRVQPKAALVQDNRLQLAVQQLIMPHADTPTLDAPKQLEPAHRQASAGIRD